MYLLLIDSAFDAFRINRKYTRNVSNIIISNIKPTENNHTLVINHAKHKDLKIIYFHYTASLLSLLSRFLLLETLVRDKHTPLCLVKGYTQLTW